MKTSFLLSLITAPLLTAGEFQPASVSSDAVWYLHSDMEALRETKTGKMAMALLTAEMSEILDVLETHADLDLLNDVSDFTLYGNGKPDDAVLLIKGDLRPKSLISLVEQNETYTSSDYERDAVHTWVDKDSKKRSYASFHGKDILIISEQEPNVKLALDVFQERKKSFDGTNPITLKAPLFLGLANITKLDIPKDDEGAELIRKAKSLALSLKEEDNKLTVNGVIDTKDERTAKKLKMLLDGLIAMVSLSGPEDLQDSTEHELNVDGTRITGQISAPLSSIVKTIKKMEDAKKK